MSFGTDRNRVKNVAKYLGVEPPAELDTMIQRRSAALAVTLDITVPDITGIPVDKVAAAVNAAAKGSDEALNRARALAQTQLESAYHGLAVDFLRSQFVAVAVRFNAAADEFTQVYDPTVLQGTTTAEVDPRGLTTAELIVYGRSNDAHQALTEAVRVAMDIVPEPVGPSWARKMALTIDGTYGDVRDLANVSRLSSIALYGHYGLAVRATRRDAVQADDRADYRAFTPQGLRIHMPESYADYEARLATYTVE